MATDLAALRRGFSIPGKVEFDAGNGGLTRAVVTTPLARAVVYLHGAHVTEFEPAGQKPILWTSSKAVFLADKPIRGGVPLIFPWFGPRAEDPKSPAHGFARVKEWSVESVREAEGGVIELAFALSADEQTRKTWPHEWSARFVVRVGTALEMALRIRNDGASPFSYEEAMHTYLGVGDVRQVRVTGLEGTTYLDKTDGAKPKPQGDLPVTITAETDRVYMKTRSTCVLHDPTGGRVIEVSKEGSDSTVVWNPWIERAKAFADFDPNAWPGMICIETCNVGEQRVTVGAGETHEMRARVAVVD